MFKRILELIFNTKKIKAFFTSKDALIFLCFLALSFFFWYLHTMRKKYEMEIPMTIKYTNVPINKINEESLPHTIKVTVKEQGYYLLLYKIKKLEPITLNLEQIKKRENTNLFISNDNLKLAVKPKLLLSTEIIKTNPAIINIQQVKKTGKVLEVKYTGKITFDQQYSYSDSLQISPSKIKVFGDKKIIDTMKYVYIDDLHLKNIKDTVNETVILKKKQHIQYYPNHVKLFIPVEKFTEKTVEIPVVGTNCPPHTTIRTFPASIKVTFFITFSKFNSINRNNIDAIIDYNIIVNNKTGKQKPIIETNNPFIFNIRTEPSEVEYLIERK